VAGEFAEDEPKATGDIVYAIENSTAVTTVHYEDEDGNDCYGYKHTVYIDGKETTIVTDGSDNLVGFVELTEIVDGVYSTKIYGKYEEDGSLAEDGIKNVANLIVQGVVTNVYNGMITVEDWDNKAAKEEDVTLIDADASEAEIIDLRAEMDDDFDTKNLISKASKLNGRTVALVLDDTTFEIVMIYVIG